MSEQDIENEIREKGLNAPRLTPAAIGRVVWYKNPDNEQMNPGIICYIWTDDMVNLVTFDMHGIPSSRISVPFFHGDAEECPDSACCWMPYQKAQAEKHAVESDIMSLLDQHSEGGGVSGEAGPEVEPAPDDVVQEQDLSEAPEVEVTEGDGQEEVNE